MEITANSTTTATVHNNNNNNSNSNNINFLWDSRAVDWTATTTTSNNNNNGGGGAATFSDEPACRTTTSAHALLFSHRPEQPHHHHYYAGAADFYTGATAGSHLHPDPHLTCLKLGKRHYFEDSLAGTGVGAGGGTMVVERHVDGFPIGKRGRGYDGGGVGVVGGGSSAVAPATAVAVAVPRCQVEGCHVALVNAKDYHRRHKVCEMHSKAPKVVVLGMEQRFCQQCSRFHVVSEFDDSKRSCRRRLAGHNERRRKSCNDSISRNLSQDHRSISGRFPCISSSTGRALSLLSSKSTSWVSPADLSSRSSAALRELMAENRAAFLARQLLLDQAWHHNSMDDLSGATQSTVLSHMPHQHQAFPEPSDWDRFHDSGAHVTLDLMQEPSSPFGFLSGRSKSKDDEEDCCDIWKSLEGTHVM